MTWPPVTHQDAEDAIGDRLRFATEGGERVKGAVVFTWDDGTTDHYTDLWPLFESRGLKATWYVPSAKLDTTGYLTTAQLLEIHADGQEIGSHGHNESIQVNWTAAQNAAEWQASIDHFAGLGINVRTFAAVGGQVSKTMRDIVGDFFDVMRMTHTQLYEGTLDLATPNALSQTFDIEQRSEEAIETAMDTALADDQILVIVGHTAAAAGTTKVGNVLDHAVSIGLPVLTMAQAYDQVVEQRFSRRGGTLGRDGSVGATRLAALTSWIARMNTFGPIRLFRRVTQGLLFELRPSSDTGVELQTFGQPLVFNPEGQDIRIGTQITFTGATTSGLSRSGTRVYLRSAATEGVSADTSQSDTQTALLVRVNRGGVFALERVSIGAEDSGGSGFRVLRVPN